MKTSPASALLVSIASLIVAACGGGGGGGGSGPTDVSGTLDFVPESTTLPVLEPNDSVDEPQELAPLHAGLVLELRDAVDPGADPLDGFRLVARERVLVTAELTASGGAGAELLVYDPVAMRPLALEAGGRARFHVRGACDLVVRATDGAASYVLRIRCERPGTRAATLAHWGLVGNGDALPIAGPERVTFTAREALAIDAAALAGAELRDAETEAVFASGPDGRVEVPALACVAILPAQGSAAGELRAAQSARSARATRVPPLELEHARGAVWGVPRTRAAAGELLVQARADADLDGALAARGLRRVDAIPGGAELVAFDAEPGADPVESARVAVALAASFAGDPRVEYAERNRLRRALGGPVTPNDTHFPLQWHYPLIHLPQAWAISTGDDAILVAVIDTGETAHPDLAGRQVPGYDMISSAANAGDGDGRDADPTDVGDGVGPQPSSFHGTHVAGTIAAASNNGTGVAGVTFAGKVMHVRVLGLEGGTDFDIANAIRYSARLSNASGVLPTARANVINMSLGGPGASSTVQSAVTAARGQGVVVFSAAGNENTNAPSYPAAYTGVISVAAVDRNANRAPYSNFGSTVDVAAPGGDVGADLDNDGFADGVLSTVMDDAGGAPVPVFAFYQGTSMACPHAAGVAALMLAVDGTLTPDEIEDVLESTATDLGAPGRDDLYGNGLIHAQRALEQASGTPAPGTPVLALAPQTLAFGTTTTQANVGVTNAGGGLLDVTTITTFTTDAGSWLSAVPVAAPNPISTDTTAIQVFVDRTGLADGDYTGTVTVDSNGGAQVVNVTMTVVTAPTPVDVDLFVLAVRVDGERFISEQQFVANPTTSLDFAFVDLPPGDYLFAAGSDDDADGFICGEGDVYCGLYPSLNEPELVTIRGGQIVGLDFPVTAQQDVGPVWAGPRGFPRIVLPVATPPGGPAPATRP
jgi:serine protease